MASNRKPATPALVAAALAIDAAARQRMSMADCDTVLALQRAIDRAREQRAQRAERSREVASAAD